MSKKVVRQVESMILLVHKIFLQHFIVQKI